MATERELDHLIKETVGGKRIKWILIIRYGRTSRVRAERDMQDRTVGSIAIFTR